MVKRAITISLLLIYLINVQAFKTSSYTQGTSSRLAPKYGLFMFYTLLILFKNQKMK